MPDFREIVKALVWQFAYRGNDDNRRWLSTGGLTALKDAFEALGWDDPHYVEGGGVNIRAAQAGLHVGRPHPRDISIFAANTTATGGSNDARHDTHRWEAT